MKFILFYLLVSPVPQAVVMGEYFTMDECFEEREAVVEMMGRPIINYQAVCVIKE